MNYQDALDLMEQKMSLGIMPGLDRISALLNHMGNPQQHLRIIHIAGTNGKGTVANFLAASLQKCGFCVGLFTSPWVTDYREQIQIDGRYISREEFTCYAERFGYDDATEFELLTAIAYRFFYDRQVDFAVIECGMGGLNDSTNAIPTPEVAVITSVSFDHTDFLGNSLQKIAAQKAGIIKSSGTAVLYPNPETEYIFREKCKQTGSRLLCVQDTGDFLQNDIAVVKTVLSLLKVNTEVQTVVLPARQEYLSDNIMIDGAHNTDGALALQKKLPDREITAVIGMLRDKNIEEYLSVIAPRCKKIITVAPSHPRAESAKKLAKIAEKFCKNVIAADKPSTAVAQAQKNFDFLLICGSFYLARDIRKVFI